ncbi:uncharacterized protein LOC143264690 [Megachile rotundata]|uniref:uncharacterized protein LOC143264690 n=1 Tax=Megachile rotundata TaxID=143995 RepID=UPI003FD31EE6
MEEPSDKREENELNDRVSDAEKENEAEQRTSNQEENLSPSRTKETVKVKRKIRSTRRRLNAMINNASLHFSDTDSEGELTTITYQPRPTNHATEEPQGPTISVTLDNEEAEETGNYLSTEGKERSRRNSFIDNLTDVDEIYPSEPETEQKEGQNDLKLPESPCQGETDLEEVEADEEVASTIYVKPRLDLFCEYSETITTKEGDGPFSVEVRNKMYKDDVSRNEARCAMPDIVIACNTDEEDMEVSDDEDTQEACCSRREVFEDLDVLAGSQVFMKNVDKTSNLLNVKDTSDDAISDCHTDIEDVDPIE